MNEQSKFLRLNSADFQKLLKGAGIAFAGVGGIFILGVFDVIDVEAASAVYTAIGSILVNFVIKLLSGPKM